jgi:hypothetical protein
VRGVAGTALSWEGLFGLLLIPLVAMPLLSRRFESLIGSSGSRGGQRRPGATKPPPGPCPSCPATALWLVYLLIAHARLGGRSRQRSDVQLLRERTRAPEAGDAAMVVAAAILGFGGLVVGRYAADHLGRRVTAVRPRP